MLVVVMQAVVILGYMFYRQRQDIAAKKFF